QAEKVSKLPKAARKAIAAAIRDGVDPVEAVADHSPHGGAKPVEVAKVYRDLLKAAGPAVDVLEGRTAEVRGERPDYAEEIELLTRLGPLSRQLVGRPKDRQTQKD